MPFLKRAVRVLGQVVAPNPLARKAVDHFTRPVSTYWTPQAFHFLEKKGAGVIERILVCRTPVSGTIQRVLNLLSLGKFDEAKRDLVLDKLYHTEETCWCVYPNTYILRVERDAPRGCS